ncbi:hypothetical protein [Actinomadura rudentiformis]|uniref:Uncharacterized protein n=1 Tax=Actinomadura rudentiformis TaxID=359158 RepID=A0A6H9YGP0_9ACTN|nr:hypothetical protein [Actinomadura rudentiformis]KAB2344854.1 hypothetical protein F8566_30140 [Actinomadura rudentiformis]
MRALGFPIRTETSLTVHDPTVITHQLLVVLYGGKTLIDPATTTRYCLVCLEDVPPGLLHEGVAACCL